MIKTLCGNKADEKNLWVSNWGKIIIKNPSSAKSLRKGPLQKKKLNYDRLNGMAKNVNTSQSYKIQMYCFCLFMTSYLIHQLLEMQIQALPFMMTLLCDLFGIYLHKKYYLCLPQTNENACFCSHVTFQNVQ